MLKTYAVHWPENRLLFRVPYQKNQELEAYGQRVELVQTNRRISETVAALIEGLPDDEWIYWCIDDKFVIALDADIASYLANWVTEITDPAECGLSFCRARALLQAPAISDTPLPQTAQGESLLPRDNFNNIWLHQFLRVRILRSLFSSFPATDFKAIEMDSFTRQGPNPLKLPDGDIMYVTERNHVVLGESTVGGHLTRGCLQSMRELSTSVPEDFELEDVEIVIGSLGTIQGE